MRVGVFTGAATIFGRAPRTPGGNGHCRVDKPEAKRTERDSGVGGRSGVVRLFPRAGGMRAVGRVSQMSSVKLHVKK